MIGRRQRLDTAGREIRNGALVAYNLSGSVAFGVVEAVPTYRRGRWSPSTFKIRLKHDALSKRAGHISTVRHAYSILVLPEEES